jgi:uncharacterized protein involved in high-affinity Fe2+ transport
VRAEEYAERSEMVAGWEVRITTYRIGEIYYSHVDNCSPGATIARGEGKTREEADDQAVRKAREALERTPSPRVG